MYVKPLAEILDEFDAEGEMEKKKYMKGGHLNPKVLDDFLQKKSDKPVFGEERMTKDAIIELMEEFDSAIISHGTKSVPTVPKMPKPVVTKLNRAEKPYSNFVPSTERAITKKDHAKVASKIDSIYIKEGRNLAYSDMSGQSKVEAHRSYLNRELQLANCPAKGPDIQRLRIYSELFEIIIKDFRTYNELLAEIKNEYDLVIGNFSQRDEEIIYLRTKIQKLVAQNENRVLLRFEKERCKALEERIKAVEGNLLVSPR